jgi:hypothetical protein
VSGYTRAAKNLIQSVVRNAGHYVPTDQPVVALYLIKEFAADAAARFSK